MVEHSKVLTTNPGGWVMAENTPEALQQLEEVYVSETDNSQTLDAQDCIGNVDDTIGNEACIDNHRRGLAVLAVVCAVFAFLDWLMLPGIRNLMWFMRFGLAIPFILISLMLTYVKPFKPFTHFLTISALVLSSCATIAMMVFAPSDVATTYFAAILIHIMLCFGLLSLEWVPSIVTGTTILAVYNIAMFRWGYLGQNQLIMHNTIFVMALGVGIYQGYNNIKRAGLPLYYTKPESAIEIMEESEYKESIEEPSSLPWEEIEEAMKAADGIEEAILSESKRGHERELREAGHLFNLFMERISDVVWYANDKGQFTYVSPSCERIWGFSVKTMLKKGIEDMMTTESYNYFEAELKTAKGSKSGRMRPMDLDIQCKNNSVKTGETVAIAFKEHETFGNGVIGVTRDMTFRKQTEAELKKFNRELEGLIKQRSTELEHSIKQLKQLEEAIKESEHSEPLKELPFVSTLRNRLEDLHTDVAALQESTHQIKGIYDIKMMKKEDLEQYFERIRGTTDRMDSDIRSSLNLLFFGDEEPTALRAPESQGIRFRLGDYIENVLLNLGHRLMKSGHMIEIDCPDEIEVVGEPGDFSKIIKNLVEYSLDVGLDGISKGEIEIQVKENQQNWQIWYSDNGHGLQPETFDQLFERPYQVVTGEAAGLQLVRDIVKENLNGEFKLNSQDGGLTFEITIPKDEEMIA